MVETGSEPSFSSPLDAEGLGLRLRSFVFPFDLVSNLPVLSTTVSRRSFEPALNASIRSGEKQRSWPRCLDIRSGNVLVTLPNTLLDPFLFGIDLGEPCLVTFIELLADSCTDGFVESEFRPVKF